VRWVKRWGQKGGRPVQVQVVSGLQMLGTLGQGEKGGWVQVGEIIFEYLRKARDGGG